MTRALLIFALAGLAGCSSPPDVSAALGPEPAGSDYPTLLPVGEILAIDAAPDPEDAEAEAVLTARAAALRRRAAALAAAGE